MLRFIIGLKEQTNIFNVGQMQLHCIVFHGIVVILSKQLLPELKELFTELILDNQREV